MNELLRLRRPATTGFSTDHTADSVNRFISQRQALTSRPETNEQRGHAAARTSIPLEHLYPSLYTQHASLFRRGGNYLRAFALKLANGLPASAKRSSTFRSMPQLSHSESRIVANATDPLVF
jgi:hypothetical protein